MSARYTAVHENGRVHMETANPDGSPTGTWAQFGEVCEQANLVPMLADVLRDIVRDLPSKRDWLDPGIEARARAALAAVERKS
jgi:hypothetical protein